MPDKMRPKRMGLQAGRTILGGLLRSSAGVFSGRIAASSDNEVKEDSEP
jgi:hypothetical protein